MNEIVSIIIPAYNAEKYIVAALESVIHQSYKYLDIIVINDGSQDKTESIVKNYSKNDRRIRLFSIANQGVCVARNTGLENMIGTYYMFLDSDDFLDEFAVETMLTALKGANADICYAKSRTLDCAGKVGNPSAVPKVKTQSTRIFEGTEFLKKCLEDEPVGFAVWAKLYKKTKFEKIRFVAGKKVHEDSFYVFQTAMMCPKVICLDCYLHNYLKTPNSASRSEFSEKYLDILYFAERKEQLVLEKFPQFKELTYLVKIKANMALLNDLVKARGKKYQSYEKRCIKEIIRNKQYFKANGANDERWFKIIVLHLYWMYKKLWQFKNMRRS